MGNQAKQAVLTQKHMDKSVDKTAVKNRTIQVYFTYSTVKFTAPYHFLYKIRMNIHKNEYLGLWRF